MTYVLRLVWLPIAVVFVTVAWLWLDRVFGWRGPCMFRLGLFILLAGACLVTWCIALFRNQGRGTPLPFVAKTQRLVTTGPYHVVRNPMMWGVAAELVGIALLLGSLGLWFGIAMFVLFIALFVPLYEEHDLQRRFGDDYRVYCQRVPRWLPRLRRNRGCWR